MAKKKVVKKTELDEALDDFSEMEISQENSEDQGVIPPVKAWTTEWREYVFSQIDKEDMMDGFPSADALMWATEEFVGEIAGIHTEVIQAPSPDNERRATVSVSVTIDNKTFTASADAYNGNVGGNYGTHPVATAETRALGRCLRRLLKLKKTITAEEGSKPDNNLDGLFDDKGKVKGKINDTQITGIDGMCKRININFQKFLTKNHPELDNIREVSHVDAKLILSQLSAHQNDGAPKDIEGYEESWKKELGV
jgi:hypothetical protein